MRQHALEDAVAVHEDEVGDTHVLEVAPERVHLDHRVIGRASNPLLYCNPGGQPAKSRGLADHSSSSDWGTF